MFPLTSRSSNQAAQSRDPFSLMDSLFSDWLTARPTSSLVSRARLDVAERDGNYEVHAELPGAKSCAIQQHWRRRITFRWSQR